MNSPEQRQRRNRRTRRPRRPDDDQFEAPSETAEQFDMSNNREQRRRPRRRDEQRIVPFGADGAGREVGRRRQDSGPLDNITNFDGNWMGQN